MTTTRTPRQLITDEVTFPGEVWGELHDEGRITGLNYDRAAP